MTNFTVNFPPERPKRRMNPFIVPMLIWLVIGLAGEVAIDVPLHTGWGIFALAPYVAMFVMSLLWKRKHP